MPTYTAIGIDPSLSSTGIACVSLTSPPRVRATNRSHDLSLVWAEIIPTSPKDEVQTRLVRLIDGIADSFSESIVKPGVVGIENLSRGSPFMREEMGMAHACAQVGAAKGGCRRVELVTPQEAKRIACPRWPGFSLANWEAAGYTTKFKRSMPGKSDVIAGLYKRFRLNVPNPDMADAVCIAIAAVARISMTNPDVLAKE